MSVVRHGGSQAILTVIALVFTPEVEAARTPSEGSPDAPGVQLQKRYRDRHGCLAIDVKSRVVVALRQVKVLYISILCEQEVHAIIC